MSRKVDLASLPWSSGSSYPAPFDSPCADRSWRDVSAASGLTRLGVNIARIPPGVWSSQRHWHSDEDEFVYVLEGEVCLITDAGEEVLRAGDCAAFKAGESDGHHLINRGDSEALVLQASNRDEAHDRCDYPDLDMIAEPRETFYRHRDGTPWPAR